MKNIVKIVFEDLEDMTSESLIKAFTILSHATGTEPVEIRSYGPSQIRKIIVIPGKIINIVTVDK